MAKIPTDEARRRQFSDLFDAWYTKILAYARRRLPSDIAEDAVAETFLTAWKTLDNLEGDPLLWLYGIARRCIFNQRRTIERAGRLHIRLSIDQEMTTVDHGEIMGWEDPFVAALAQLREPEREVLRLVAWEHLSAPQAAAVLGCSPTAFKVRLHRARHHLRALLNVNKSGHSTASAARSSTLRNPPTTFDSYSLLPKELP
jgi:RNA polymerase sigma-70 factor (ECF subfamily)